MKTGAEKIADERERQIKEEGFNTSHDDKHTDSDLSNAAICYAEPNLDSCSEVPIKWPWNDKFWKPSDDSIKNLVRAGALIAAEIDRIQRVAFKESEDG